MGEVLCSPSCSAAHVDFELKTKFSEREEGGNQSVGQEGFLKEVGGKRAAREELVIEVGGGRIRAASRGIAPQKRLGEEKKEDYGARSTSVLLA